MHGDDSTEKKISTGPPGIIILGMHRSGTSLIAELVQKWGAYGDDTAMLPSNEWNPRGFWEPAPLVRLNDELLGMFQSRWNVPPSDGAKIALAGLAEDALFRRRAIDQLTAMRASGRPWFWKDPRLAVLLPFWKQFWEDVVFVVPVRDPGDIARSLRHRNGFPLYSSLLLWHRYTLEIFGDEEVRSTGIFVCYEDLLADPRAGCERLCRLLDERLGAAAPDPDYRAAAMTAAVDPALWRSRNPARFLWNPIASEAQKNLYGATLLHAKSQPQPVSGNFPMEPGWRETLTADNFLQYAGVARTCCQIYWRSLEGEYAEDRSDLALVAMDGTPQAVHLSIPPLQGPENIRLRVDLADRPALVWLVAMELKDAGGNVVWAWDGRADSIAALVQSQVGRCEALRGEDGCLLRFDGYDPWVEIVLSDGQSAALSEGAIFDVCSTYSASLEHFFAVNTASIAINTRGLEMLEKRQAEGQQIVERRLQMLEEKEAESQKKQAETQEKQAAAQQILERQLQMLEQTLAAVQDQTRQRLQIIEAEEAHIGHLVHGILNSKTWKTMTGMGRIPLAARRLLVHASGSLSRRFRP